LTHTTELLWFKCTVPLSPHAFAHSVPSAKMLFSAALTHFGLTHPVRISPASFPPGSLPDLMQDQRFLFWLLWDSVLAELTILRYNFGGTCRSPSQPVLSLRDGLCLIHLAYLVLAHGAGSHRTWIFSQVIPQFPHPKYGNQVSSDHV
jgi:hypothetical protein